MNIKRLTALAGLSLILAASGAPALAGETHPEHDHHTGTEQKLQLDAGHKWATDQPLRQAMDDINQAMTKALPLIHQNRFSRTDYQSLARGIQQEVGYAVEHCKLEPDADAMLHIVITDLIAATEQMGGRTATARHAGAAAVLRALQSYAAYFEHPGWKPVRG